MRDKLVTENPFAEVKASTQVNKERQFHVDRETIFRVIDAAPNAEWRLIIALSRFGGLRCPSEHLALRWQDMDWERNRFRVDSPKTGERWIPMFPELRSHLEEAFDLAEEGAVHIITGYRSDNVNMRMQLARIIRQAGVKVWPKLFHNLRASRETELAATYPIHVVCQCSGDCGQALPDRARRGFREGNPRWRIFRRTWGAFSGAASVRDCLHRFARIDGSPRGLRRYAGECNAAKKNIRKRASPRGARNNTTLPECSARENLEKESSQGVTPHVLADMETHEIGVF